MIERYYKKGFYYNDGSFEDVQDFGFNVKGYGCGYSHPRHLNTFYNRKIKNFKDMDKALDDLELIRVLDDPKELKLNIGNKATIEQLALIKSIFEETKNKKVKIGITSISRKFYYSYNSFIEALNNHNGLSPIDKGNREFKTHTSSLSM